MSARYQPVGWNRNKIVYDLVAVACITAYVLIFLAVAQTGPGTTRPLDGATLRMQALGSCAFLLLTATLAIGPLARLDGRFLPLLYNRRHLGVLTCTVALAHAAQVLGWYYAFSPTDPYTALLGANTSFGRLRGFPFEVFGIVALSILAVLAATSHDFWLSFLGPALWKAIHMSVYVAYAAVVAHVSLGALQAAQSPMLAVVVMLSVVTLCALHLAAGRRERTLDLVSPPARWVDAGPAADIADGRAVVVSLPAGERVAVFRDGGRLSAVSNVCAHQNGPLGEGRVQGGCVTCPWHGYQYRLADGCAPPPFTEKIATYRLRLDGGRVLVDGRANPPGTPVEPLRVGAG